MELAEYDVTAIEMICIVHDTSISSAGHDVTALDRFIINLDTSAVGNWMEVIQLQKFVLSQNQLFSYADNHFGTLEVFVAIETVGN